MADQAREIDAGGDVTRPTHQGRYPKGPFPIGVFLTAEGGGAGIGPAVDMGAVVGAVHDDRVVADAQLINEIEQFADALVVIDHHIVVFRLPAAAAADVLGPGVGAEVHVGGVEPHKKRLAGVHRITDEAFGFH